MAVAQVTESFFTVTRFKEFSPELEILWMALENTSDHFCFQTFQWQKCWFEYVGRQNPKLTPLILVIFNLETPVALFSMCVSNYYGARVLQFLGGDQNDYNIPLVSKEYASVHWLRKIWVLAKTNAPPYDLRWLRRVPSHTPFVNLPDLQWRENGHAHSARFPENWNDFLNRIPNKIRADTKRQINRLEREGDIVWHINPTGSTATRVINALIQQKQERYRATGAVDKLAAQDTQNFYRFLTGSIGLSGRMELSALEISEEIIAVHWGCIYRDTYYWLMPSYAAGSWGKFSPGRILQEYIMKSAFDRGIRRFDFTVGDEPYKKLWCNETYVLMDELKLSTLRGIIAFSLIRLVTWIKTSPRIRSFLMNLRKKIKT